MPGEALGLKSPFSCNQLVPTSPPVTVGIRANQPKFMIKRRSKKYELPSFVQSAVNFLFPPIPSKHHDQKNCSTAITSPSADRLDDPAQFGASCTQQKHVLERGLGVGGAEQHAVFPKIAVDHLLAGLAIFAVFHGHREIHPRGAGFYAVEELLVSGDFGRKIGNVKPPGDVLVLGKIGFRRGHMDIAKVRRRSQRLVKDDLGKPDVLMELVEPLMRRLASVFKPDAGSRRDLLIGQEAPFGFDPVLCLAGDPPGSEKVGVDRRCRNR